MHISELLDVIYNLAVCAKCGLLNLVAAGGKSAILTALCVAFGCRAKGTQRASTLKDFIKTGCRFGPSPAPLIFNCS